MSIYHSSQSPAETSSANLALTRQIILDKLKGYAVQVYLFGSYARGNARPTSDIDVGILPTQPLPIGVLANVRDTLFESTIPVNIDIVNLSETDESFKQHILPEAIVWID